LIGAYVFVLAVLFVYVFSVARRLTNVQRELDRLDTTIKQGGRA
jgi:CcmD family protein